MANNTTYIIPGRTIKVGTALPESVAVRAKRILAYQYASKHQFNPHNWEAPWYGYWDGYVNDIANMTADLTPAGPSAQALFIVVPQHDMSLKEADRAVILSSGGTHRQGASSIGSDASMASAATAPLKKGSTKIIPDFAVILVRLRTPAVQQAPGLDKLAGAGVPLLFEVKKRPKRSLTGDRLLEAIENNIQEAEAQLKRYAKFVFRKFPDQRQIILVACVTKYWTVAVLDKNADMNVDADDLEDDEDDDDDDDDTDFPGGPESQDTDESVADTNPRRQQPFLTAAAMANALGTHNFTRLLENGKPASNQFYSLIVQRMHEIQANHNVYTRG